ncbi:MAG: DUF4407 domain-containing protein [Mycobacterium sp.]|uniref:DUF4407 domain-containing protein n=1 Tax=Mycobacterium sp. TaxID=1785 RepID=UPI001EC9F28A|nr:DUF4407 domain-containing protein [Mycobacterium sp.]MBV8786667.1 DUF4407 domain-containing protein [Mycobacterium sp.]
MCAQEVTEQRSALSGVAGLFTWLGGGHRSELGERHERSTHAVTGAVVLFGAVLAGLVAGLAVSESTSWPILAVVAFTLVFAVLIGAVSRGIAAGARRGWSGVAGRAAVATAVGVVVGELAALVVLSSSIDHRLDERALRDADTAPAVVQASVSLQQAKNARNALDTAVEQARERQDQALVIARCEYHPTPSCPQTRITGVPGTGPETRTADELLADAQHELDNALATRDSQAPESDAKITHAQQALDQARHGVVADAGRGLGTRWVAMNDFTLANAGALTLRLLTIGFCVLVYLLPLILGMWRGETTHDRHATARADRERAELEAETAIAIKRAEVRREAEILWAEHQLTQARLAIEAQTEIDREQQRRRVIEAFEPPVLAPPQRTFEPADEDIYLPIAAEAEAASRAVTLPPPAELESPDTAGIPENLPASVEPALVEPGREDEPQHDRATPLIPSIPGVTKAAARWIRPLVPPIVARVIDTTTAPLRSARHAIEEVVEEAEEITISLKRTRSVKVNSAVSETSGWHSATSEAPSGEGFVDSARERRAGAARRPVGAHARQASLPRRTTKDAAGLPLESAEHGDKPALTKRDGPPELDSYEGPRQLPPSK